MRHVMTAHLCQGILIQFQLSQKCRCAIVHIHLQIMQPFRLSANKYQHLADKGPSHHYKERQKRCSAGSILTSTKVLTTLNPDF